MPFFLLGIGADGRLTLLDESAHPTRQAALSELSRLTAEPSFDRWDDEVLVVDTDSGTPVLLVRPIAVPMSVSDAPEPPAQVEPPALDQPEGVAPAPDETPDEIAAVLKDLDADETASVVIADEDSTLEAPEPAWAEAMTDTEDEKGSLRDALFRTAVHMESEGISAPESVGLEEAAIADIADIAEEPAPEAVEESPQDEPEAAADATEALIEDTAPEAIEAPTDEPALDAEPPVWPWDSPSSGLTMGPDEAIPAPPVAEAQDEAVVDLNEIVLVDEVVLDEIIVTPEGDVVEEVTVVDEVFVVEVADESEDAAAPEPAAAEGGAESDATPEPESVPESDFIDLDVPVEAAPVYEPGTVDMTDMTCDDCVYVETCPNKDDRTPATCGSFQWK